MSDTLFRIHPAIGFARVGNSKEYYLAPETLTGHPLGEGKPTGGLPIKAGTEDTPIKASDLRDKNGALKRQAARFRIYQYQASDGGETYPMGQQGREIQIGDKVQIGGATKTVTDILWSVHMANKKTAWYQSDDDTGVVVWRRYQDFPPLRNKAQSTNPQAPDPNDPERLRKLVIDPGPRTITGKSAAPVQLDKKTPASYIAGGAVKELPNYPKTFPKDAFEKLYPPKVDEIDSLGTLETDDKGRLIVAGGYGRANSFNPEAPEYGFDHAVNNDYWFDDTGDGPVDAVLVFDDHSTQKVQGSAWVIATDPAYAPQILNVVSLWDDLYDTWVRKLDLRPELKWDKDKQEFTSDYRPSFEDEVHPIFLAASLQRWVTNLSVKGISAHQRLASLTSGTDPADTQLHGLGLIREPVNPEEVSKFDPKDPNKIGNGRGDPKPSGDDLRMPLSLGDAGRSMLSLTRTQYFFLKRWDRKQANDKRIELNHGELLDKAALLACLGGRFGPGIDMTYIVREPELYVKDWKTSGTGPFRINPEPVDYAKVDKASNGKAPFLSAGWRPLVGKGKDGGGENIPASTNALEPGDISKFMSIPWHADYNSCGIHLPSPNPPMSNTLYWSWPAQRPVAVYVAEDVKALGGKELPDQRYSVRGPGTKTTSDNPPKVGPADPGEVGRYQMSKHNKDVQAQAWTEARGEAAKGAIVGEQRTTGEQGKADGPGIIRILDNWMKIGTVIQATNIDDGGAYDPSYYLEVQSKLSNEDKDSDAVRLWPNTVRPTEPGQK